MPLPRIASMLIAAVPLEIMQRAAAKLLVEMLARNPQLFDRLGEHAGKRFAFVPTDLPFAYMVTPAGPILRVVRQPALPLAEVTVKGPIVMLLALLEGRLDGDALFFSRQIEFSGDTEAMLALRNALDDNHIDLPSDLALLAGPLAGPVRSVSEKLRGHLLAREKSQWN